MALYTDEGDIIHMKRGRLIEIETDTLVVRAKMKVRFETPLIEQTGDLKADGEIADHARSMQADRDLHNQHDQCSGPKPSPAQ
nr:hypothetical protein [uncultured Pseudomonas sp.]